MTCGRDFGSPETHRPPTPAEAQAIRDLIRATRAAAAAVFQHLDAGAHRVVPGFDDLGAGRAEVADPSLKISNLDRAAPDMGGPRTEADDYAETEVTGL